MVCLDRTKMLKIESLYFGDMRLDALKRDIMEVIISRCEGQDIPIVTVVGILHMIQNDLYQWTADK